MMPHQWKYSSKNGSEFAIYPSVRGDMKAIQSNEFTTVSDFSGLIAIFAKPNGEKDADGTATLKDSSGTLADGVTQLNEGAITLKDGMAQFNSEAIEPITKLVDSDAQTAVDTIKAVVKAGQEYNSFLGKSDDKSGSVTFVYKTAGITANN